MPVPRTVTRANAGQGRLAPALTAAGLRAASELAGRAAPASEPASWPPDFAELADKIERQTRGWGPGGLGPSEDLVRNKDRKILRDFLPPCVGVQLNDPEPFLN